MSPDPSPPPWTYRMQTGTKAAVPLSSKITLRMRASAPLCHAQARNHPPMFISSCPLSVLALTGAHACFLRSFPSRYHKNFLLAQNCCNRDPVYVPSSVSCFEYFPDSYDPGPPYCKPIIYIECQDTRSTSCNVVGPQDHLKAAAITMHHVHPASLNADLRCQLPSCGLVLPYALPCRLSVKPPMPLAHPYPSVRGTQTRNVLYSLVGLTRTGVYDNCLLAGRVRVGVQQVSSQQIALVGYYRGVSTNDTLDIGNAFEWVVPWVEMKWGVALTEKMAGIRRGRSEPMCRTSQERLVGQDGSIVRRQMRIQQSSGVLY